MKKYLQKLLSLSKNTMDDRKRPVSKKVFLLLAMITLPILLFMLSNDVNKLSNNNKYPRPKSDPLFTNPTKYRRLSQDISKTDIITYNLTTSTEHAESDTSTRNRKVVVAYPKSNTTISNVTISTIEKKRLPQAILIGAMKCGTRALTTMMEMHSKFVAPVKEIHFFDKEYDRGLRWYRSQMPYSYEDQITFEKSPSYFKMRNPDIPSRIHSMNSSIRLILIVRDPVIRSISHFVHRYENGNYRKSSFEKIALRSDGTVNRKHPIISYSLYKRAFKMYLRVFSPEQILVIDGERLIQNPLPIIQKVERFFKLETEITKYNFYFDKDKGFYCMKQNENKRCLGNGKGREHPKVDTDTLRKLRQFFAPYNQKFYDLVDHNFGWATS